MTVSEPQIKHLEFIQAAIARQASHSFAAKGWSVTVCTAGFFYAVTQKSIWLAVISAIPWILFAFLDAYYLRNERAYRCLYNDVRTHSPSVQPFEMGIKCYLQPKECTNPPAQSDKCGWWSVLGSVPWFAMQLAVGSAWLAVLLITIVRVTQL